MFPYKKICAAQVTVILTNKTTGVPTFKHGPGASIAISAYLN